MGHALVVFLTLHGLLHLVGFAKGTGIAELPRLRVPISRAVGMLWLAAAAATLASAALFVAVPRTFWIAGSVALVLSQAAIVSSWRDARLGTLANVLLFFAVALGVASYGPWSLWAEYHAAASTPPRTDDASVVREEELATLPDPVQRYLRVTGTVGQARVRQFRATWKGRIRADAASPWMAFDAEQHNVLGPASSRFFFMTATMKHMPVSVFHRFVGADATFRVRVLSAFTIVDARGPEMNRSETVTMFNDACLFAPSALLDPSVQWEPIDTRAARARYTRGAETITAELRFDDAGQLVDFVSDDRSAASPDGKSFTQMRWTTPVRNYRAFGARHAPTFGEARWVDPKGGYVYGEFELVDLDYDGAGWAVR